MFGRISNKGPFLSFLGYSTHHSSGIADVASANASAAEAAEELDDPEGGQEGCVLLVGPVIGDFFILVSGD